MSSRRRPGSPAVVAMALGGSRATGEHRPDSDWDLGVYYRGSQRPLRPADVRGLGQDGPRSRYLASMTPQHDEILRRLDDGLVVAWDTTRIDRAKLEEIRAVGARHAAELGRIIDGDAPRAVPDVGPAPRR